MSRERKDIVTLYNIAVAAGSKLTLKEVIWQLYKEASEAIDPNNIAIVIYEEALDLLNFYLVFDRGQRLSQFSVKHSANKGLTSQIIAAQKHLLLEDLTKTKLTFEVTQRRPGRSPRSWLGAPFSDTKTNKPVQGAIVIWSYRPRAFGHRDLWFMTEISTQAAIAIRNAYLFEASQRRAMEMAVINDVAQATASTLELEKVLQRIMDQVEGMLNVTAGFILLVDQPSGDLVFQIALGVKAQDIKPFRIPRGVGVAGRVAASGQPMIASRKDRQIEFNAHNVLCVPLMLHEQVIGVLEVLNKRTGHFTRQDMELLSAIGSFAAIAIENARLHENVMDERDRVIEAGELARRELARDLHDGPIQLVSSLAMRLNFCQTLLERDPQQLNKELPQAHSLAEQAMHQMRTTLFELRPLVLETEGLEAAIKIFLERRQKDITGEQHLKLKLNVQADTPSGHITRQEPKVEATLFAIVQEAVNNAIKHARTYQIKVELRETPVGLYVSVIDKGQGFDVNEVFNNDYTERVSLGMVNIKERADLIGANLAIRSQPGKGTRIRVYIPKAKDERLKNRGRTGMLSTSKMTTGMLTGFPQPPPPDNPPNDDDS